MKTLKFKKVGIFAVILVLFIGTVSFALESNYRYRTNVEILSEMTGKTVEEIREECVTTGKNIWALAKEDGILEEFKEEIFETKKIAIENRVKSGALSEEDGSRIIENFRSKQKNCTGLGGNGSGMGARNGNGNGQRLQDGSCLNNDNTRNNENQKPKVENNNSENQNISKPSNTNQNVVKPVTITKGNNNGYKGNNSHHQGNGGGNGIQKRDGTGMGCRR